MFQFVIDLHKIEGKTRHKTAMKGKDLFRNQLNTNVN